MDKVLSSKLVFKCPKFKVYKQKVLLETSKITTRWPIIYNDSVVIIGITSDKKIILIREYRESISKTILLLPGGGVKENEKPKEAAIRELEEETGYISKKIKLFKIFDESTSKIKHKIYYYLITDLKLKKQKLEKDEEIAVLLFSFKEISYKIKNNLLEDKTDKKALKVLINSITAKNKKFFDLKAKN